MDGQKIEETKTLYSRMQRDGFSLDYLNIEYNINEIKNKVDIDYFPVGNLPQPRL